MTLASRLDRKGREKCPVEWKPGAGLRHNQTTTIVAQDAHEES
jgi:hypothetical protein